ncbi:DUF4123 domain-containing protein [Lysobacter sp. A289]
MGSFDAMSHYYLFDGVQLRDEEHTQLEGAPAVRVYADLGETAARTGPMLVEHDATDPSLVAALNDARKPRHALAELTSPASLESLGRHLVAMRYLHLNEYSQHFLRYADTRAFSMVVQVLSAAQLSALFGPVEQWSHRDRSGRSRVLQRPDVAPGQTPLHLDQAQQRQLFRLAAPDQLLAEVLADEPALTERGDDSQRHGWVAGALDFLEQRRMRSFPWRLAVANAAVRSSGKALDDPSFADLVDQTFSRGGDTDALYNWESPMETAP